MARYTDDQVQEILRRAIESDAAQQEGLTEAELIDAAREIGISAEHVEKAAIEVREKSAVEARRVERRRKERQRFAGSVVTYLVVNAFLALLDYMTGPGWWVQWPLVVWGLFLALDAVKLVSPKATERRDEKAERRHRRAVERERRRRAREEARHHRSSAEVEFEQAVERGVAALLGVAARSLDELVPGGPSARRETDFGRYVKERERAARGGGHQARPPQGPRARVDASAEQVRPTEEVAEEEVGVTSRRSRNPR